MGLLTLLFEMGETSLEPRSFRAVESVSRPFTIEILARSPDPDFPLEPILNRPLALVIPGGRMWTGICAHAAQLRVEPEGLSTYALVLVPTFWALSQRRNYRIFQHLSVLEIAARLLEDWGIEAAFAVDPARYPRLDFKVQYGESDFDFVNRLLEEAGIAYVFFSDPQRGTVMLLVDALASMPPRPGPPIPYMTGAGASLGREVITHISLHGEVRPGAVTVRDQDFRRPAYPLFGLSARVEGHEALFEHFDFDQGAFVHVGDEAGDTPTADDRGPARHGEPFGHGRAGHALAALRSGRRAAAFHTNSFALWPGVVFAIGSHPHPDLAEDRTLLVTDSILEGSAGGDFTLEGRAVFTAEPYQPPRRTPKPRVLGVQSAVVVGPAGAEIHADEFGRVRVQFPWDREAKGDETSSCWIRVSQPWAQPGGGMINLPRVGQEVLVQFLDGDPDQPMILGRLYNGAHPVPYALPANRTMSGWRSSSSPGGAGSNEIRMEDLAGQEHLFVHAQHNMDKLVENDETMATGGQRTSMIAGSQDLVVKGSKRESVSGADVIEVGGAAKITVQGGASIVSGAARTDSVGSDQTLFAARGISAAAKALLFEGQDRITLHAPGGYITIRPGGIEIHGDLVRINVAGEPGTAASPDVTPPSPAGAASPGPG